LLSKIARTLGVLAVAGTPFLMFSATPASATGGCSVNNASTSTTATVTFELPSGQLAVYSSSLTCTYVSGGGQVNFTCTLVGGICQAKIGDAIGGSCIAYAGITCNGHFIANPGDEITFSVYGGSGTVSDAV
jgi:hypothetical protein